MHDRNLLLLAVSITETVFHFEGNLSNPQALLTLLNILYVLQINTSLKIAHVTNGTPLKWQPGTQIVSHGVGSILGKF